MKLKLNSDTKSAAPAGELQLQFDGLSVDPSVLNTSNNVEGWF